MARYTETQLVRALAGHLLANDKTRFAELAKGLGGLGYDVPTLLVKAQAEYERLK